MMKRKHFIWIIGLLTVINLSAIGTIIYHIKTEDKAEVEQTYQQPNDSRRPQDRLGRFFREELELSMEQHQQFRSLRRDFHIQANELTFEMQIKRKEMITELAKEKPDIPMLKDIARNIGDMHTELKELTIEYYLGMKEICTPEQEEKLYKLFEVIINRDGSMPMPGRSGRPGNTR